MRHILFSQQDIYPVAILIKSNALRKKEIVEHYIEPMEAQGLQRNDVIAFDLEYKGKRVTVKQAKAYLENLLPALKDLGTKYLYVADAAYFKVLTGVSKAEPNYGYVIPCKLSGYEDIQVVLGTNHQALFYNPDLQQKLTLSINTLIDHMAGNYKVIGSDIVHSASYPHEIAEIHKWLDNLHAYPELSCDIEAFSLQFYEAGIATIGFAWDEHNGIVMPVDYHPYPLPRDVGDGEIHFGYQVDNTTVKNLLRLFFEKYEGKLIFHNICYDAKVLIYELWMMHPLDYSGMLRGIEIMTRHFDDTQILSYLATNSCAGNKLSLKDQAHEFAGNYAQEEINDVRRIPLNDLLQYNLIDCLSTSYVKKKHDPTVDADDQRDIYNRLFKPSVKVLLQMELVGLPQNRDEVANVRQQLEAIRDGFSAQLRALPRIQDFDKYLRTVALLTDFEKRREKAKNPQNIKKKDPSAFDEIIFNPNSNPQVQELLYNQMGYPVIDLTDSKQPAVGAKTLKKLLHQVKSKDDEILIQALIGFSEVEKILSTFITAFENKSMVKADGVSYLHGNFKLGGTVSGRLSSSGPNLMNMPSTGTQYAKYTKGCFQAPTGWIIVGADFSSLEDRISALTTKDPNKLKVYLDGYDGHCLRAYGYFGDRMPDIVDTVESINSIADKYPDERQDSKAPTFLLTYGGTYHGLMANVGLSEEQAKSIEANYHELYKVSDQWVANKLKDASVDGYVTVAFGLRVRTPVLAQCVMNSSKTPYEAQSEGRTAGNALGQSYGMLNNRAAIEFQERCLSSPYREYIHPIAHIHDAQYFMILDHIDVLKFVNDNLIECMQWQDLPDIQHPTVKLGGQLSVFYPTWANEIKLPNGASKEELRTICEEAINGKKEGE